MLVHDTYTSRGGGRTIVQVTWCHGVRDPDVCQCVVCVGGVTRRSTYMDVRPCHSSNRGRIRLPSHRPVPQIRQSRTIPECCRLRTQRRRDQDVVVSAWWAHNEAEDVLSKPVTKGQQMGANASMFSTVTTNRLSRFEHHGRPSTVSVHAKPMVATVFEVCECGPKVQRPPFGLETGEDLNH